MVAATTIITPIWLKMEYRKDQKRNLAQPEGKDQ
jgi:hypothetical protein